VTLCNFVFRFLPNEAPLKQTRSLMPRKTVHFVNYTWHQEHLETNADLHLRKLYTTYVLTLNTFSAELSISKQFLLLCEKKSPLFHLSMTQHPVVGHGFHIIEASRSYTLDTPHSVGLLWTSDQPDAETST
jgi:hypothetical protein